MNTFEVYIANNLFCPDACRFLEECKSIAREHFHANQHFHVDFQCLQCIVKYFLPAKILYKNRTLILRRPEELDAAILMLSM